MERVHSRTSRLARGAPPEPDPRAAPCAPRGRGVLMRTIDLTVVVSALALATACIGNDLAADESDPAIDDHDRATPPTSTWVTRGADGKAAYRRDDKGNRIPDFSH